MMLAWKIFVTIMSMVSLTFQMEISDLSGVGSSSGEGSSSGPSQFMFYDEESQRYYPTILNDLNTFPPPSVAYKCYAKIRLFCQSKEDYPQSEECAKKGILFYRTIPNRPLDCADKYFHGLSLDPGNLQFPEAFCREKGEECINELQEYSALVKTVPEETVKSDDLQEPKDDLQKHLALVKTLQHEAAVKSAEKKSRKEIAKFTLIHKDIFELDAGSFERKYLEHISEHVTSANRYHNAFLFCKSYERLRGPLKIYSDLRFKN